MVGCGAGPDLTGLPYWLLNITRGWLDDRGFAAGPVQVADSHLGILPTEGGVGDYKLAWLTDLEDRGYHVDLAYGDPTSDIYA